MLTVLSLLLTTAFADRPAQLCHYQYTTSVLIEHCDDLGFAEWWQSSINADLCPDYYVVWHPLDSGSTWDELEDFFDAYTCPVGDPGDGDPS
jgi:hypothetical protein